MTRIRKVFDDDDYGDHDGPDPPLYASGELAALSEEQLCTEWQRQCNAHDNGVDNLPMGHPTIENAAARLRLVEAEQKRRGFEQGPGESWFADDDAP